MNKFSFIFPYYKRYWRDLTLGFVCVPFTRCLELLIPLVIGKGLDWSGRQLEWTSNAPKSALDSYLPNSLYGFVFLVIVLAIAKGIFQFIMRLKVTGVSRKVESDLKNDLFRHLSHLSFRYFNQARVGDLISRSTQDVEAVRMFTGPGMMYVTQSLIAIPIAFVLMGILNFKLTLVVVLPLFALAIAVRTLSPKLHSYSETIQKNIGIISNQAVENFAGVRVVKGFHIEDNEIQKFSAITQEYRENNLKMASARGLMNALIYGAQHIAFLLILAVGGYELMHSHFTIGEFFTFISYVFQLFWPLIALGWIVGMYHRAVAAVNRVQEIMQTKAEIHDLPKSKNLEEIRGKLEFRNVHFAYNGAPVLKGIHFALQPGQTLGIVGKTGAGKTTLISLIPRLFEAQQGEIFLDDTPLSEIPLEQLRHAIGFVPQDNFLFSDTMEANIAFGQEDMDRELVVQAAASAKIANEIRAFPKGFQQMIGERGVTLSGGQKQRTSIARALAIDPKILIFDDCLSSVDPETERELIDNLHSQAKGRTTIIVAHRLSVVQQSDHIIVLDQGRILEQGTHEELLAQDGWYAETWSRQQIEKELEQL